LRDARTTSPHLRAGKRKAALAFQALDHAPVRFILRRPKFLRRMLSDQCERTATLAAPRDRPVLSTKST
jgi:hypothetical protein